ncbi:MAG: gamma carbonic anhydrase family protein [Erysipelotrichaceae bacterium]|nr:gamma carbonic anhydrase family protein [Erysipelotrichaceae bacterium]
MSTWIAEDAVILGDAEMADGCSVYFHTVIRTESDPIRIGRNTNIQDNCTVHTGRGYPVIIGEGVTVGHGCIIHGCTIGDNTLIGMGSIIMDGAVIGRNCIIGAGSLITEHKVIPDGSLVFGSPAKVIRTVTDEEIQTNRLTAAHYLEIKGLYENS